MIVNPGMSFFIQEILIYIWSQGRVVYLDRSVQLADAYFMVDMRNTQP